MQRVAVVVQRPASEFKIELSEMVVDSFRAEGAEASLVVDGDDSLMSAAAAVLFGDCLGFRGSEELLRAADRSRPETTLWQLEPFPHALGSDWQISYRRAAVAVGWSRLQKSSLFTPLRLAAPKGLRSITRRSVDRLLIGDVTDSSDGALQLRNRFVGVRRFARISWIERAVQEGWLDHIVVSAPERAQLLATRNIRSRFLPVGYHPEMGSVTSQERDLDAVFLGRVKRGRKPGLDRLSRALRDRGVSLTLNEGPCFGEERRSFLSRAKISVNILNDVWELSRSRLMLSMACGALVISEPVSNPSPFIPGQHLVTASTDEMPDAISRYLAAENERRAIVEQARDLISTDASMRVILRELTSEWDKNPIA
jgi:glycosyltransferase involved in cell wall biosynthesis